MKKIVRKASTLSVKLVVFIMFLITFCNILLAQSPQKMSYQAIIRDSQSSLIINQMMSVKASILFNSANGVPVYSEIHHASTNENGLLTLELGAGTVIEGVFSNINWGNGTYYIKTEIDLQGGSNYTISHASQLLSVPYALFAQTASSATPINAGTGLVLTGNTLYALHQDPMWNANALMHYSVSSAPPALNDVLRFNGSQWSPAPQQGGGNQVSCNTSFNNNYTIRGTGNGNWECTNDVYITSTGAVGIGSTSPSSSYNLTVGTKGFLVNGTSTTSNIAGRLRIGSTSSSTYDLQVDGQTYITNGLRVGTTSSPPSNGIRANGDIQTGSRFIQGSSTAGTGTVVVRTSSGELRPQSSTIKVKEKIEPLHVNKNNVFALQAVTYRLKPALGGQSEVGLIAEQVEKVLPELVVYGPARSWIGDTGLTETDSDGNEILDHNTIEPYSIHYERLAVYLLEIIKEQENRIFELERKVEEISNK